MNNLQRRQEPFNRHPHNVNWPADYKPSLSEIHTNFARLIAEGTGASLLDTLDLCGIYGCVLVPDFEGIASPAYLEALKDHSPSSTTG